MQHKFTMTPRQYLHHQADRLALTYDQWIHTANVCKTLIIPAGTPLLLGQLWFWNLTQEQQQVDFIAFPLTCLSGFYLFASRWLINRSYNLKNPHRATRCLPSAPPMTRERDYRGGGKRKRLNRDQNPTNSTH